MAVDQAGGAEAAACLGAIEAQSMAPDETVVLVSADALRVDGQARAVVAGPAAASMTPVPPLNQPLYV